MNSSIFKVFILAGLCNLSFGSVEHCEQQLLRASEQLTQIQFRHSILTVAAERIQKEVDRILEREKVYNWSETVPTGTRTLTVNAGYIQVSHFSFDSNHIPNWRVLQTLSEISANLFEDVNLKKAYFEGNEATLFVQVLSELVRGPKSTTLTSYVQSVAPTWKHSAQRAFLPSLRDLAKTTAFETLKVTPVFGALLYPIVPTDTWIPLWLSGAAMTGLSNATLKLAGILKREGQRSFNDFVDEQKEALQLETAVAKGNATMFEEFGTAARQIRLNEKEKGMLLQALATRSTHYKRGTSYTYIDWNITPSHRIVFLLTYQDSQLKKVAYVLKEV